METPLKKVSINAPGKYYVDIITPNCGTKTDTINFKLLDTPVVNLYSDTISCDSVRLVLDAGNANNEATYKWNTGDSVQAITAMDTGLYKVVVSNFCGIDSSQKHITQHYTPTVSLPADTVFCDAVSYFLQVGRPNNGETYNWGGHNELSRHWFFRYY